MRPHLLQYDRLPRGPFRIAVLLACLATIAVLGLVRVATEAQFAFASLMLVPVLLSAWYVGPSAGWGAAGFATGLWAAADYGAFEPKSLAWVPFANAAIRFLNYGLVIEMARRLQHRLVRESTEATVDILTGLPNRRGFFEAAEREIEYARRLRWPVALVYIDLDRFKVLNDTCGHEAGDAALRNVGMTLKRALRSTDVAGRLGGDEFAVVFLQTSPAGAGHLAAKLRRELVRALRDFAPVGASIGLACFDGPLKPLEDMLRDSDRAMYRVKHEGKHRGPAPA